MVSIRTLLVENDIEHASLIQARLGSGRAGRFDLEHRPTLDSALTRLEAGNIDLVLLDLELAHSSGMDALERLHVAAPNVPVLVVTDVDDAELALRSVQARAEEYLTKEAADEVALVRAIRHSLERHRLQFELKRNVGTLSKSEARFRTVVSTSSNGVVVVSRGGVVLFANPSAARLLGHRPEELRGDMLGYPFALQTRLEVQVDADRCVEVHVVETEWDDKPVWLASLFDITEHKRSKAHLETATAQMRTLNTSLERLASIDPLTELLNRRGLEAELALEMRRKRRTDEPLAAVLIDCDDFKRINETLGHSVGDVVLKELAQRLGQSLRSSDHLGRLGGDEFLVLLPATRFAEAFQVCERLRLSVSDSPLRVPSGPVHVTASLGMEMITSEVQSIDEVLVRIHASLQNSKQTGKNRVSTQGDGGTTGAFDSENLALALRSGTAFRVLRQPIMRLRDETAVGWEMLARGPEGVFEMPRDFFRVALERDILTQVDLHCLKSCIRAASQLPEGSCCHVNMFPATLHDVPIEQLIELFPRPTASLSFCVEISEQQFIGEPSLLRRHVRALREAGIRVAIDDVGFGRSSLETLILLEPDSVKIDPRFVRAVSRDADIERSLRRMVGVITSMGSESVAEGVESREDLELLLEIGVNFGQGFLWGQPS